MDDEIVAAPGRFEPLSPPVPERSAAARGRLEPLDALRGLAALGVVLLHYTTDFHKFFAPLRRSAFEVGYGAYGVHLFFMISGFVILMSAEKASSGRAFLISRFSRLYPPYWAAVAFTAAILLLWPLAGGLEATHVIHRALVNLTMFQSWIGVGSIDSVYWTLQVEMSFYIVILVLIRLGHLDKCLQFMTGLVLLSLADHLLIPRPIGTLYTYVRQLLFLEHAYLFTVGIVLYKLRGGFKPVYLLILLLCACAPLSANYFPNSPPVDTLMAVAIAAVLYLATSGRMDWISIKPLLFLGSISYSLYLTHHWLGLTILKKADEHGVDPNLALAGALLASLIVATFCTYAIERPSLAALRRRAMRR